MSKELEWSDDTVIYDTVAWDHLEAGETYELRSTVYEVLSHFAVIPVSESVLTEFTAESTKGSITVDIPCDTRGLSNKQIVVVQELYKDDVLVVDHMDFTDTKQQLHVEKQNLTITTEAKIMGERNGQEVQFLGNSRFDSLPIEETVNINGIPTDRDYFVRYHILDKATGNTIYQRESALEADRTRLTVTMENLYLPMRLLTGDGAVVGVEVYENTTMGPTLIASHMDTLDLSETVTVTRIQETKSATDANVEQASGLAALQSWKITDDFNIDDTGKWIEGGYLRTQILDAATEEVLFETESQVNDEYGGWDHLTAQISDTTRGTVTGENLLVLHPDADTLPAAGLAGRTLVLYEQLMYYGTAVAHTNPKDKAQRFTFSGPVMETEARSLGSSQIDAKANVPLTDMITITGWPVKNGTLPDGSLLRGYVINKDTREIEAQTEKDVTGAEIRAGIIALENEFTLNLLGKTNTDLVVMEQLLVEGKVVCAHEDLNDENQTVEVDPKEPELVTSARNAQDGRTLTNMLPTSITDSVTLDNLKIGRTYTLKAVLADKTTGEEVPASATEVTFTADSAHMVVENIIPYDAYVNAGRDAVVFERLYQGSELLLEHTDLNDEEQTLHVEKGTFRTLATGVDDAKVMPVQSTTIVSDHLTSEPGAYKPDTYYRVRTSVVDRETGQQLMVNEQPVEKESTVYVAYDGQLAADITIIFSSLELADREVVLFEEVYTGDEVLVSEHHDLDDSDQTLKFLPAPAISTLASDASGEKLVAAGMSEIYDKVSYAGLATDETYTLEAELVRLSTGEIIAEEMLSFVPDANDGEAEILFLADTSQLAGETLVVYEELFDGRGNLIADHVDGGDEFQQIKVSAVIRTFASNPANGTKYIAPAEHALIRDVVEYDGFEEGRVYSFAGKVVDAQTGEVLAEQEEEKRAEGSEGEFEFTFDVDTSQLTGSRLVVTYSVTYAGTTVAVHDSLDDMNQTVMVLAPDEKALMTGAAFANGEQSMYSTKGHVVMLKDTLYYKGLEAGHTYGVITHVWNADTGQELALNGRPVIMEDPKSKERVSSFEAQTSSGSFDTVLSFRIQQEGQFRLVIGQEVYDLGLNPPMSDWTGDGCKPFAFYDKVIDHMDTSDAAETLTVLEPVIGTHARGE